MCELSRLKNPPYLFEKCSHWTNPLPLTADVFMDSPLREKLNVNILVCCIGV